MDSCTMSDSAESPIFEDADDAPIFDNVEVTTQSAGQTTDENKGRIFPCEECGADLVFHIGQQRMKCPYCGFEKDISLAPDAAIVEQDFHAMLEHLQELREQKHEEELEKTDDKIDQNEVRCESCGATVVFVGSLTSSECPYCGSPIQLEEVHKSKVRVPVDGVLPFLVPRARAESNLREWVNSRWFAPNDFREAGTTGKFNGVYLPYWTYDSMTSNWYTGERGEYYYVTVGSGDKQRRERRTRWYPASGSFQRFFDDVLVTATKGLSKELMLNLEPWPLGKCLPFNQEALAGYMARTYELELDDGFASAKARIDEAIASEVRQRIGGDTQQVHSIDSRYDAITFKHLLLPTWLMAYRYRDEPYQVVINAATGEVQGDRPYSWVKITCAVLTALAVVITVYLLGQS